MITTMLCYFWKEFSHLNLFKLMKTTHLMILLHMRMMRTKLICVHLDTFWILPSSSSSLAGLALLFIIPTTQQPYHPPDHPPQKFISNLLHALLNYLKLMLPSWAELTVIQLNQNEEDDI